MRSLGVVMLSLAGCTSAAPELALDDLPAAVADVSCEQLFSCCDVPERAPILAAFGGISSAAECKPALAATFDTWLAQIGTSVDSGRARYDAALARTCLDSFAGTCANLALPSTTTEPGSLEGCQRFVIGLVSDNGDCDVDFECESGSCESGRCTRPPALDEPCPTRVCARGLYCDATGTGQCNLRHDTGASCYSSEECLSGNCVRTPGSSDPGLCQSRTTCDGT